MCPCLGISCFPSKVQTIKMKTILELLNNNVLRKKTGLIKKKKKRNPTWLIWTLSFFPIRRKLGNFLMLFI